MIQGTPAQPGRIAATSLRAALLNTTVIVAALGYFVDIYDLVLFSVVRVASLKDLGVPDAQLMPVGVFLINMQMTGMFVGGLIWGVLGDKRGRLSVLFGSIILYSLANIANAFATTTDVYAVLRFIAGVGLAGELGAAITLVSETLPKESRGYGTSFVAGFGVSGAVLAFLMGANFSWRTTYVIGGVLGLCLLVLRIRLVESGLYAGLKKLDNAKARLGDFKMLFNNRERFMRYARCILIGAPTWFVIGVLATFSPEITRELGATGPVSAGSGILFTYLGLIAGDFASGFLSQALRSRRRVVFLFLIGVLVSVITFVSTHGGSPEVYYALCFGLGIAAGYWALFVSIAAEQFGTNLRATVATTTPNFVRGSTVICTMLVTSMRAEHGLARSCLIVGVSSVLIAFLALWGLPETFGRDLEFLEK